jgi:hypothetical protein
MLLSAPAVANLHTFSPEPTTVIDPPTDAADDDELMFVGVDAVVKVDVDCDV